jgi:hypothetical protein
MRLLRVLVRGKVLGLPSAREPFPRPVQAMCRTKPECVR